MEDVYKRQAQEGIEEMAARLFAKDKSAAVEFLPNYTNMTAQSTFDTWTKLGTFLIVKYNDGVVKPVKDGKFERNSIGQPAGVIRPGYPKAVSYTHLASLLFLSLCMTAIDKESNYRCRTQLA